MGRPFSRRLAIVMVFDSNIVIAYLAGRPEASALFVSTVTECEVLSFPKFSLQEFTNTEKFLNENFVTIPFDSRIAGLAASIRRQSKLKLSDAAIAATALSLNVPLLTRDHHFRKIKELTLAII